jgi:uncharacterized protein
MSENKQAAWIDITATNAETSRTFYARLFGWRLQVLEAFDYALIEPGPGLLIGFSSR